jgi:hypothetical protein
VVPFVAVVHHEHEHRFREEVGLVRVICPRRELELQEKVDRVLGRRFPLEAAHAQAQRNVPGQCEAL